MKYMDTSLFFKILAMGYPYVKDNTAEYKMNLQSMNPMFQLLKMQR